MATLGKQKVFTRIGIHADPTLRTSAGSPTFIYPPLDLGGLAVKGTQAAEELELERNALAITHVLATTRNGEKGRISLPFYPEQAGTILGLAINDDGGGAGKPSYFVAEEYLGTTLGASWDAGTDTGRILTGCLADSLSFSVDRGNLGALKLGIDLFVNSDAATESSAPSPTWPSQDPYTGKRVLIDVDLANNSNTLTGWTGDLADVLSFGFNYQNNLEVALHRADLSSDELDGTWTQVFPGTKRASIDVKLLTTSAKYLDLDRLAAGLRKCAFRVAGYSASPSGSTTCTSSLTAGSSVTVAVAATTGFALNDYVLLWQPTANKFAVAKVTTVNSGVSLVVDTLDVTMDGASETIKVRNGAWEFKIPDARIRSAPPKTVEGNKYVVSFQADALVSPSGTAALSLKAYDDNGS